MIAALETARPGGEWVPELIALAEPGLRRPLPDPGHFLLLAPSPPDTGGERRLPPPRALLKYLLVNATLENPRGLKISDRDKRALLLDGDPTTLAEARALLEGWTPGTEGRWWLLEGPSSPDAFVDFEGFAFVLEGKRTEREPTTSTWFMPVRHQMLRHMDAALEACGKPVVGLFVLEGDRGSSRPTEAWVAAVQTTVDPEVVNASLPHRTPSERQSIVEGFAGATTWGRVVQHFDLDPAVLLDLAPGYAPGPDGGPVWTDRR